MSTNHSLHESTFDFDNASTPLVQWVSLQLPPNRLIGFKVTHVDGVPV